MTQPLIQQLAARAGFALTPKHIADWITIADIPTKLLFELCAYLDEQTKAQVLRPEITIQEDEPAASSPLICAEHGARVPAEECVTCRAILEAVEPPAAPEVAELAEEPDGLGLYHDRPHVDLPGMRVRCEPEQCTAERDEAREALARVETEMRWHIRDAEDLRKELTEVSTELAEVSADRTNLQRTKDNLHECIGEAAANHAEELAKVTAERKNWEALYNEALLTCGEVTAERDELKACELALLSECRELGAKRDAMAAVVEATRDYVCEIDDSSSASSKHIRAALSALDGGTAAAGEGRTP